MAECTGFNGKGVTVEGFDQLVDKLVWKYQYCLTPLFVINVVMFLCAMEELNVAKLRFTHAHQLFLLSMKRSLLTTMQYINHLILPHPIPYPTTPSNLLHSVPF